MNNRNHRLLRYWKFLNRYSFRRIIALGMFTIILVAFTLHSFIYIGLNHQTAIYTDQKSVLEQDIQKLSSLQTEWSKEIPHNSELPLVLDFIRTCMDKYNVSTEEVTITNLPSDKELKQAMIKIKVTGDYARILASVTEIQNHKPFPFLFEELDISEKKAQIHIKIFYL